MVQRFQTWHRRLPYTDPLELQLAQALQILELCVLLIGALAIPIALTVDRDPIGAWLMTGIVLLLCTFSVISLLLLRRGHLQTAAIVTAVSQVLALCGLVYLSSVAQAGEVYLGFAIPIMIAGTMAGRPGTLIAVVTSVLALLVVGLLEQAGAPGSGIALSRSDQDQLSNIATFGLLIALTGYLVAGFRGEINAVIATRRARERELESLSRRLETTVRERTADLEMALGALEQRAVEAERLLAENQLQRGAIRALSVPVLPLDGRTLVMPLIGELDTQRLDDVQSRALDALERLTARRLLLDITGVPLVDTHVARSLIGTVMAARLLGAEVVLVGVRPEVAQAIVALGIDLGSIPAFADLQSALR